MRHQAAREYQKGANKGDERLSLCDTYYRCLKCYKILDKTKRDVSKHICHEWYCFCCQEFVVGELLCYYRIKKPKTTEGRFIYYDFETSQAISDFLQKIDAIFRWPYGPTTSKTAISAALKKNVISRSLGGGSETRQQIRKVQGSAALDDALSGGNRATNGDKIS